MKNYDLVSFTDNDQRIAGFPWATFVKGMGESVVAGPLREDKERTLHRKMLLDQKWFNRAHQWKDWNDNQNWWGNQVYATVSSFEVPWLEIHFALFDPDEDCIGLGAEKRIHYSGHHNSSSLTTDRF